MVEQLDANTITRMIPQIFDQMRSQTNSTNFVSTPASISTQKLLKEQEQLDNIISVLQKLNKMLKDCKDGDLERIKETCTGMNMILDKFINIQSQATYVKSLMQDEEYLKYVVSGQSEEDYLNERVREVDELRKKVEEKTMHAPSVKAASSRTMISHDPRKFRNSSTNRNIRSNRLDSGTGAVPGYGRRPAYK